MLYYTCPRCGANLDPWEKCDCEAQDEQQAAEWVVAATDIPGAARSSHDKVNITRHDHEGSARHYLTAIGH